MSNQPIELVSRRGSRIRALIVLSISVAASALLLVVIRFFYFEPKYDHNVHSILIADCNTTLTSARPFDADATAEELESALGERVKIEGTARLNLKRKGTSYIEGTNFKVNLHELSDRPEVNGRRVIAEGCLCKVRLSSSPIIEAKNPNPHTTNRLVQLPTGYFFFLRNADWQVASIDGLSESKQE